MQTRVFGPDLRTLTGKSFNAADPDDCVKIVCPFHNDTQASFGIYPQHGFCHGCHTFTKYRETIEILGGEVPDGPAYAPQATLPPPVDLEDLRAMAKAYQERMFLLKVQGYLTEALFDRHSGEMWGRGLSLETVRQAGLGYRDEWWGYSIPIYSFGKFETIRYRRLDGEPKYIGTKGRNQQMLYTPVRLRKRILWVEGEFDCLTGCQLGYSTVTMTNGVNTYPTEEILERLREHGVEEADICVDNDRASFGKSFKYADLLEKGGIAPRIRRLPEKDLNATYLKQHRALHTSVDAMLHPTKPEPVEWWRE